MPLTRAYLSGIVGGKRVSRQSILSKIVHQTWGPLPNNATAAAPIAASTNGHITGFAGPNTTTITKVRQNGDMNGAQAGKNDWARNIVVTVTHASAVVAVSGLIIGLDIYGQPTQEAWSVTAGTTSKTYTGVKGFSRVDQFTVVAVADASADTVALGFGNVLGLLNVTPLAGAGAAVKEAMDASLLTTGTLVAGSFTAPADVRGTYLPATVPNGAHTYDLWYLVESEAQV